jgi:L-2-hydroxyglutarate oxidase LhgO
MDEVNVTIIGAGVVGLAIASELSKTFEDVVVLEQHDSFGQETSSRNSEVIHSGIYYPHNSLKTKLCIEGAQALYELCEKFSIPYKKLGKIIVAKDETETATIENLFSNGIQNSVRDIRLIGKKDIARFGNTFKAVAAIYLPNTGIIDSHSLMKHFAKSSQERGATIAYNSRVVKIDKKGNAYQLMIEQENYSFLSRIVINCSGLSSDKTASLAGIDIKSNNYKIHFCKGSYFSYSKRIQVPLLIYPAPHKELTGLGVHATLDLGGRLRFGPDTEYVEAIDYKVNEKKREAFFDSAVNLFPSLEKEAFIPDMSGIRPKLSGPDEKIRDFIIVDEKDNGLPGFINLIGIESPGLTASPAIAKKVSAMVIEQFN